VEVLEYFSNEIQGIMKAEGALRKLKCISETFQAPLQALFYFKIF
jgi:hypothetical protein